MFRLSILAVATLFAGVAAAQSTSEPSKDHVYKAPSWGAAIHTLPCDAFTRLGPGTWRTNGTFVLGDNPRVKIGPAFISGGTSAANDDATGEFTALTLNHTPETQVLDQRCGK